MKIGVLLLSLLALATTASALPGDAPPVRVEGGLIQGARNADGTLVAKGIPYAAPPVGPLRWRPPQPARGWTEVRDATRFGAPCFQAWSPPALSQGRAPSEDCLTLNVWAPPEARTKHLPVMVWLHGGGFQFGSSAQPTYDGAALARRGVIVVTLNYRLGVLGFLAHPSLDAEETPSGNYGLRDQIAALRWVRRNIGAFGGDNANVTVFGESAGAHAIGLLMASPLAKGLFAKAIVQSGAFWDSEHGPIISHAQALTAGRAFQAKLGSSTLAELRAMSAEQINAAAPWSFAVDPATAAFAPSLDPQLLPEQPRTVFAKGKQPHIPLLGGTVADEGSIFLTRALPHATAEEFRRAAAGFFASACLPAIERFYPSTDAAETSRSATLLIGDLVISEQTLAMLSLQSRAGARVYGYEFAFTSPYWPRAIHGSDPAYVFGTLAPRRPPTAEPGAADRSLTNLLTAYWTNFARAGDPNGPGLPDWPTLGSRSGPIVRIDSDGVTPIGVPNRLQAIERCLPQHQQP